MRLQTIFFLSSSIILASCSTIPRPYTDLCLVNAQAGYQRCYNLHNDYNNDGVRNPKAVPTFKAANTVMDLDRNICVTPEGYGNLLIYIRQLRDAVGQ